jgi:hypothetical protein
LAALATISHSIYYLLSEGEMAQMILGKLESYWRERLHTGIMLEREKHNPGLTTGTVLPFTQFPGSGR